MLPRRSLVSPVLLSTVALAALAVPTAESSVVPRSASLEGSGWTEFSQTNASTGTLSLDRSRAYDGAQSAKAVFSGGANGYSRGIQNVDWQEGDEVWYGAAFYLPEGFKAAMQGQVDLLRWDNFLVDETNTDRSGVIIYNADKQARVMRQKLGVEEVPLAAPFSIPEGRWFHLEVHQKLSQAAGALTEVFLDGDKVATSTQPNTYGRGVNRIRTGIVAIDAARQRNPLTLWFDRATVATSQAGALGALPAAPAPAPASAPAATAPAPAGTSTAAQRKQRKAKQRRAKRQGLRVLRASASSRQNAKLSPARAVDGRRATRWSSEAADGQWWRADLGRRRAVSGVQLHWESAFASRYAIDVSKDGRHWRTVAVQRARGAGVVRTTFRARPARYVRVRALQRGTGYGISFWEARILRPAGQGRP